MRAIIFGLIRLQFSGNINLSDLLHVYILRGEALRHDLKKGTVLAVRGAESSARVQINVRPKSVCRLRLGLAGLVFFSFDWAHITNMMQ